MEQRYIYSGSLTQKMVDYLLRFKEQGMFDPIDVLVSQLDRSGVSKALEYMDQGLVKSLFIDSGAYSEHSQGIKLDVDEYISYVNGLDDKIIAVAQVDHIPGVFKQPKKPEDYVESAELSWKNFLYMYPKMKSPEKLIAVFHQGESFEHLKRMLEWKDENGKNLSYIGISPSNDRPVMEKDIYLKEVYEFIEASSNPNVRTHLFGYTSLPGLPKFPWYTCDSVSHRLRAAYNKIYTNEWGTISLSSTRSAKSKADQLFTEICDEKTLEKFKKFAESYGFTVDQLQEESAARTALDMCEVQKYVKSHPYHPSNRVKVKRLVQI